MTAPTYFENAEAFRRWLERHAATTQELIVGFHKVGTGKPSMTWSESVDEALCFGWIDAVRKRIDDASYLIRFTRRKPTSIWSAINIAKLQSLHAQGPWPNSSHTVPRVNAGYRPNDAQPPQVFAYRLYINNCVDKQIEALYICKQISLQIKPCHPPS